MRKLLFFVAACLFTSAALAQLPPSGITNPSRYGRWLCTTCQLADFSQATNGVVAGAASEVVTFIKGTVNANVPQTGWQTWESVDVCDGVVCVRLYYYFGNWYFAANSPDSRARYKNSTAPSSFTPVGTPGYYYAEVYGHWEETLYFSQVTSPVPGPVIYTGSDYIFVIDSARVFAFDSQAAFGGGGGRKVPIY